METIESNQRDHKMVNIIICGAPGSGKGTQSDLIIEKYKLHHISTGDLLRSEIAAGTVLGQLADSLISKGQLVPDDVIIGLISKEIDNLNSSDYQGVILDGFPRTVAQAEALEAYLAKKGTATDVLINLDVDEQELINRLLLRGKTSGRNDDNLDTIKKRLVVYHNQTMPVADFYGKLGKHVNIHGVGTVEEIFERIKIELDKIFKK